VFAEKPLVNICTKFGGGGGNLTFEKFFDDHITDLTLHWLTYRAARDLKSATQKMDKRIIGESAITHSM